MNSEPARVVGFISERAPWGERESPIEHVAQTVTCAFEDLNLAICTAQTRHELVLLRELTERLLVQLDASRATALAFDEWFNEMRGRQE